MPLSALPEPKPSIDWFKAVPSFPMYGNDVHGDCAIAAIGHMVQVWSANARSPVTPDPAEIQRVYAILSPNDDGCVLDDVLTWWTKNPICGIQIPGFAVVDPQDPDEFQVCLEIFGGLYCGAQLPLSAQVQTVWDVVSGSAGKPGSWGGHCFNAGKYGPAVVRMELRPVFHYQMKLGKKSARVRPHLRARDYLLAPPGATAHKIKTMNPATNYEIATWGQVKEFTQAWGLEYLDEAYAIPSPDWFNAQGVTPEGLNLAALQADMADLQQA